MIVNKMVHNFLVLVLVLLVSCEKAPLNEKVEGHWALEQFTLLKSGEVVPCQHLYYGITRYVTEMARKTGDELDVSYVARTHYENDGTVLVLSDVKVNGYNTDKKVDATSEQLKPFGIIDPEVTRFQIIVADGQHLVLESLDTRLQFKRF